jgi:hypothetical protein
VWARLTHIPVVLRLSTIFQEMILLAVAVVIPVALILVALASPEYSQLKIMEETNQKTEQYSTSNTVLYYAYNWRMSIWGLLFTSVRSLESLTTKAVAPFVFLSFSVRKRAHT